jgi:myosin heavy subunit
VNPFRSLPDLYGIETFERYYNASAENPFQHNESDLTNPSDPHVWDLARLAFSSLMASGKGSGGNVKSNISLLISGESGSGKTETSKYLLTYLTHAGTLANEAEDDNGQIMDRIMQSNPILEAFGNAKTIKNDNASRFGKFIDLTFTDSGALIGGQIQVYLLENVRVVNRQVRRHIFCILT